MSPLDEALAQVTGELEERRQEAEARAAAKAAKRAQIEAELPQFTGTESYYQYEGGMKLTDGALFIAEAAGAFWLLDLIASYQPKLRRTVSQFTLEPGIPFQLWRLVLNPGDNGAVATCHEDWDSRNPNAFKALVKQEIPHTDFPLPEFKLCVEDGVIHLPSEH